MKKKYLIVSIISVLIMMIGFSFAYFTSNVNGTGKEMNVSSKRLAIIFTDTKEIAEEDINPGWSVSKTFTIENRSGEVFYYDINIDDLINTFVTTGYLQYKITSIDGGYNMSEFIDIPKSEEARREKLASNIEIENGSTHTYTIEFKYPNDANVNQSDDMGKELSGSLSITESNIIIVKYKVNNVIQDEIPDKKEPYIVDKVECSNNAKGTWNEITEKVDLTGEVTQTVCIVEFKEGNTVNIITENNEVVSPVSKVVGRIGSATFTIEKREGYEIENARVTCDNGALGSVTDNIITITNITKDNTCRVETNPITITLTLDRQSGSGGTGAVYYKYNAETYYSNSNLTGVITSITIPSRVGYTFNGYYTSANGSGTQYINSNGIFRNDPYKLLSSITLYASWTLNKGTFTMESSSCPDKVNNNSSACYVVNQKYKLNSFDGIVTYNGKSYINCTIKTYSIKWDGTCSRTETISNLNWWTGDRPYWAVCRADKSCNNYASCTAEISCN